MSPHRSAVSQRACPTPPMTKPSQPSLEVMREVNQRLTLASISALEQRGAAEAALQRQLQALTVLAHELRNGLTPIQAAADVIDRRGTIDDVLMAKLHGVIDRNVKHLSRLIADILDGSRVGSGQFRLDRRSVNLIDVVRQAVASCQPTVMLRSQSTQVNAAAEELMVLGDPVRLTQVFVNLLDNASKYSPTGGSIQIAIAERAGIAQITFSDDGIGMGADILPHVFDLFFREADQADSGPSGLGVGLAVVQELVEAHGGTVSAQSAGRAQGSKFTVRLPLNSSSIRSE